jgi:hypothetical protein
MGDRSVADEFDPRRAKPGQVFTYVDVEGREHDFSADDDGVVRPKNADEARTADLFDLPVARSAKQADTAKENK